MERRQFIAGTATAITVGLAGCGILNDGPEEVVTQYFQAIADGDTDRQDELTHDEGSTTTSQEDEYEITINEISQQSVDDIAQEEDLSDGERDSLESQAEEQAEDVGADDWTFVFYDIEGGEYGQEDGYIYLVNDGGWLVYMTVPV